MLMTGLTFHKESHRRIAECAAHGGICLDLSKTVLNGLKWSNTKIAVFRLTCNLTSGLPNT